MFDLKFIDNDLTDEDEEQWWKIVETEEESICPFNYDCSRCCLMDDYS